MSEKAPYTPPDIDYAKQLRVGWVEVDATDEDKVRQLRTPIHVDHVEAAEGELTDGVRSQLDMIVSSVDSVNQHAHKLPGYTKEHLDVLQKGYVLAGENKSGLGGKTELRFASPEEFRTMVSRSVGEKALQAYEAELIGDTTSAIDEITVPRLVSTVINVESAASAAPVQRSGELKSTFKPTPAADTPEVAGPNSGKLISTFGTGESKITETDASKAVEVAPEEPVPGVGLDNDDRLEFVESNPLESRAEPEVAVAVEIEEGVESKPIEPESEKPQTTLVDVMKSPESLMSALSDTELDPAIKSQLRQVVGSWNRLQTAKVAEEVWSEVVRPRLRKLDETLPNFANIARHVAEELETLESGLTQLATAVEYGDLEQMGNLNRRYRYVESFSETGRKSRQLANDETIGKVSRSLDLQLLESDDRIKRVMRKDATDFTERDADALFNIKGVSDAKTVDDIQAALLAADQSGALRKLSQRKDAIEAMIQFGRSTDRVLNQAYIQGAVRTVENMLQDLFGQRSRMTSGDVHMIRGKLKRDLVDPIEQLHKLSRLTQMYKEEVKR